VDDRARLEQKVRTLEGSLRERERSLALTADPILSQGLRREIESLQEGLYSLRRELEALEIPVESTRSGSQDSPAGSGPTLFLSYAHADRSWAKRLLTQLRPLMRAGRIDVWDDARIEPGHPWRIEIERALRRAKVALILVSVDYLASEFAIEEELPLLLQRAALGETHVLPILIGPCDFWSTRLGQFQFVNSPTRPLASMSRDEQEQVIAHVAEAAERALAVPTS
jgi:hypothetical protein